ncbi:alpha/beta hydrolase family protein, partial [Roseomonas mucosa]|uniref:poly(ethylene terephthalate) hydrolase family protein n=5 Tax=Roseomonas TaxID=125216 RepID=UPI001B80A799
AAQSPPRDHQKPKASPCPQKRIIPGLVRRSKSLSGTVERYQATFTGRHHVGSKYFAHDQADEIRRYIEGQPSGTKVSLIGHSYGGDTAIEVAGKLAQEGHKIDTLVTVDPVGSRRNSADFLIWAKQGADRWINVNATGGSALEFSNAVAGLGGAYNERPQQYADVHFNVAATLGAFLLCWKAGIPTGIARWMRH